MIKKPPTLNSDQNAEAFVAGAPTPEPASLLTLRRGRRGAGGGQGEPPGGQAASSMAMN